MKPANSGSPQPGSLSGGVLLDSNFIVAFVNDGDRWHESAALMLASLVRLRQAEGLRLATSTRVLDEVWWKRTQLKVEAEQGRGSWNRLTRSARRTALVSARGLLEGLHADLQRCGVEILGVPPESVDLALGFVVREVGGLEPADAFHAAVMRLNGITSIVTNDRDFARVDDVQVIRYDPSSR